MDRTPSERNVKPESPWSEPPDSDRSGDRKDAGGARFSSFQIGLAVGFLAALAALIGWLFSEYGDRFEWASDGPRLGAALIVLVMVAAGIALGRRSGIGSMIRMASGWLAIGIVAVLAYSYRAELRPFYERVVGELDPSRPINVASSSPGNVGQDDGRAFAIRQSEDGHFYAVGRVNGADTRLLVDTGATVTVLSVAHAERAGIFPSRAEFNVQVRTASGYAWAARVNIRELEFGDARLNDIVALVMRTPGDISVLGMSTLQRFRGYDVRDGVLTIRW